MPNIQTSSKPEAKKGKLNKFHTQAGLTDCAWILLDRARVPVVVMNNLHLII